MQPGLLVQLASRTSSCWQLRQPQAQSHASVIRQATEEAHLVPVVSKMGCALAGLVTLMAKGLPVDRGDRE